jgi:hypothetical protein
MHSKPDAFDPGFEQTTYLGSLNLNDWIDFNKLKESEAQD